MSGWGLVLGGLGFFERVGALLPLFDSTGEKADAVVANGDEALGEAAGCGGGGVVGVDDEVAVAVDAGIDLGGGFDLRECEVAGARDVGGVVLVCWTGVEEDCGECFAALHAVVEELGVGDGDDFDVGIARGAFAGGEEECGERENEEGTRAAEDHGSTI